MNQNNYLVTTSLALAAAIQVSSSSRLHSIEWLSGSGKASFVFDRSDANLDEIVQLFWQRALPLDALTYFEALRYVKARLYEQGGKV